MEHLDLLQKIPEPLLAWYGGQARSLPWRDNPEPYRVWVSEIMLQQTRVEAVKPYYARFLEALPTLEALAAAPEDQLMKLWEGLGYYSRVRNMQKAARQALEQYGGLPASLEELRKLPGIGDYTAGAVASIAFGLPVPAVDGNVLRVAARLTNSRDDVLSPAVKRQVENALRGVIPPGRAGDFNQSLMELGAMVCLPNGEPRCLLCPLRGLCLGLAAGAAPELPVKAKKKPRKREEKTVLVLLDRQGRAALERRPPKGLLAGMWQFPSLPGRAGEAQARAAAAGWGLSVLSASPLEPAAHIFTHIEWHMTGFLLRVEGQGPFTWAAPEELEAAYALPAAFQAYRKACFPPEPG